MHIYNAQKIRDCAVLKPNYAELAKLLKGEKSKLSANEIKEVIRVLNWQNETMIKQLNKHLSQTNKTK